MRMHYLKCNTNYSAANIEKMADADSLHDIDMSSDLDADPSAIEADAESEEQTEDK